jgi:hypothetical protein
MDKYFYKSTETINYIVIFNYLVKINLIKLHLI